MGLTVDEKTIVKMYSCFTPDRTKVIQSLQQSLPFVEDERIAELMNSTIRKINAMTETTFAGIDYSDVLENTEYKE